MDLSGEALGGGGVDGGRENLPAVGAMCVGDGFEGGAFAGGAGLAMPSCVLTDGSPSDSMEPVT